ncbi:MAG TPA: twin-arginine translocation signal domain-containing protein [Planctomycetes bacterium]|nr:twin-arginine translocation signal domain-containing protein [Planctomycetota bacterium]
MNNDKLSRRDFMRNTSLMAAGTVAGALAVKGHADTKPIHTSRILNFNSKMIYRRMGKTNLMTSEVSLGGHWKNRNAGRYWDHFANEEVPKDVAKNRTEVVSAAIDCGINYLDITTAAECLCYGAALKGRRDKMYVGADIHNLGPRNPKFCNVKSQTHNVDTCLRMLQTDYLDIWRPQAKMDGSNTDAEVESLIETFQKLHKAGKVRHLGMSSHSRPWFEHVVGKYNEFEMLIFPCSAKTREKGKLPTKANIEEVNPGYGSDQTQSIFQKVIEKDIGVVTIKPYFGGSLFKDSDGKVKFPVMGVGSKTENDLARLTLQCILANEAITAAVPGLSTVYEVENAARASYTRPLGQTAAEKEWLMRITNERWAELPQEYAWLRDWEVV